MDVCSDRHGDSCPWRAKRGWRLFFQAVRLYCPCHVQSSVVVHQDNDWRSDPNHLSSFFDTLARTVAVDFDGVLHPYTEGWQGSVPVDEAPIAGAEAFLEGLKDDGFRVVVFSTRADHPAGLDGIRRWLWKWQLECFVDDITAGKPAAVAYVDDRAVPFTGDWATVRRGVEELSGTRAHGAGTHR
jgi:hypothetical protein